MTIDLTSEQPTNTPRSRHHESMPAMGAQTQAAFRHRFHPSPIPVIASALVLAVVFAATHLLPIPGGKKAVTAAIANGRLFDQSTSFGANDCTVGSFTPRRRSEMSCAEARMLRMS
jgi:hypothetical protein